MSIHQNNKKIVKNTLALYFRQIITMVVALFTSRVVLQTLGVTDYGINNVVGGVVAMFGFISSTLMGITQRFITVEIGKGSHISVLRKIFSTSMVLHILAAVAVLILAETVGLWFLNNKLVIPAERMIAANWVYQFAVFGFILSLLNAPLMALIISHEDMHIYGYMGIFDVVARLLTVYLLVIVNADKLMFLALFGFIVSCLVWTFYAVYCRKKYKEAKFSFAWDKSLAKEIGGFGGWTLSSSFFVVLKTQGVNIILNMFFGPVVNAARGIANTVDMALLSFGNNFRQALNPQLMKSYSANNKEQMWSLAERGTRMTYFMFLIFSVPVLLKTEFILKTWLGIVPEYAVIFTRLMLIEILLNTGILGTLSFIINATGKVKAYCIIANINSVAIFVFSYIVCKMGYEPYYVFIIPILTRLPVTIAVFALLKKLVDFSILFFTKKAFLPMFFVSVISIVPFYFVDKLFSESILHSAIIIIASMLWTGIIIMTIGLKRTERIKAIDFIKRKIMIK